MANIQETISVLKEIVPKEHFEKVMYKNILQLGEQYNWWDN